ncbi:MAG: molybdenum cofactor biosynthesis protein MoaE [bacterium]
MIIKVASSNFETARSIDDFLKNASVAAGTILFHHGRVKLPGKTNPAMTHIRLEAQIPEPVKALEQIARSAKTRFGLLNIMIIHRIGLAFPKDDIMLAGVCTPERTSAFSALKWIVDEIKTEKIIRLIEE